MIEASPTVVRRRRVALDGGPIEGGPRGALTTFPDAGRRLEEPTETHS
jgi:hypothetical protein